MAAIVCLEIITICYINFAIFNIFVRHLNIIMIIRVEDRHMQGPSWSWWYGSWIYNYLCSQFLFEPRSWQGVLDTTLCGKFCQWL